MHKTKTWMVANACTRRTTTANAAAQGCEKKKSSKMGFSMFKSRFLAIEREFPLGLSDLTGDHVGLSHHMIGFHIKIRISQIHASKQGPSLPG
jgi:hypothetical protein